MVAVTADKRRARFSNPHLRDGRVPFVARRFNQHIVGTQSASRRLALGELLALLKDGFIEPIGVLPARPRGVGLLPLKQGE